MIPQHLQARFDHFCHDLKTEGINIVACLAAYGPDAHFSTRISIESDPVRGITEDHVVLDALREIMTNWHDIAHRPTDRGGRQL